MLKWILLNDIGEWVCFIDELKFRDYHFKVWVNLKNVKVEVSIFKLQKI